MNTFERVLHSLMFEVFLIGRERGDCGYVTGGDVLELCLQ